MQGSGSNPRASLKIGQVQRREVTCMEWSSQERGSGGMGT